MSGQAGQSDESHGQSWRPLRHRLNDLVDAYSEEQHSDECGFGPCVRCVVDEFAAALAPAVRSGTPSSGGTS